MKSLLNSNPLPISFISSTNQIISSRAFLYFHFIVLLSQKRFFSLIHINRHDIINKDGLEEYNVRKRI